MHLGPYICGAGGQPYSDSWRQAVLFFHAVQGQRIVPIAAVNIAAMIAAARVDPAALHLLALGLRAALRTTIPANKHKIRLSKNVPQLQNMLTSRTN